MRRATSDRSLVFARRLRREQTDAEKLVWSRVRAHRLAGLAFRRQVPMLGYIADFVCHEAMLVVELDGGQHTTEEHVRRDERRDSLFEVAGFRVLRFFNPEVYSSLDAVIETIYRAALERIPEHPDHRSGGGAAPSLPSPAVAGEGSAATLSCFQPSPATPETED